MLRSLTYQLLRAWHAVIRGPRLVLQMCLAPFLWLGRLFVQLIDWWSRRETKYLIRGLPSLFVFSMAAYLLIACRLRSDDALSDNYLAAAKLAKDPQAATLLYERVVTLRPADEATLFELAMRSIDAKDQMRAQVVLQKLAPPEGQGYPPAQIFMGRHYLKLQHLSINYRNLAEQHLTNAINLAPDDREAHALLGHFYFLRGAWELAIRHLEKALDPGRVVTAALSKEHQAFRLLLAKAYSFEKNRALAQQHAEEVRRYFKARVDDDPREDVDSRIVLADACMFLEDFESAAQTLEMGLALNEGNPSLRQALARFNVAWSDSMLHSGQGTRIERFGLLSRALQLDPNYAPIFDRIMKILTEGDPTVTDADSHANDADRAAAAAREFLLTNVAGGDETGLSHLLLGSAAFESDDAETAAYHLERASELLPNAPIVENNLAWFLAFRDPPDLNRALLLINDVLNKAPHDPRFLDTRGQIYTKLERWDEAIRDLELALDQSPPGRETHEALARCYSAKGLQALSDRHRQLADPTLGE